MCVFPYLGITSIKKETVKDISAVSMTILGKSIKVSNARTSIVHIGEDVIILILSK